MSGLIAVGIVDYFQASAAAFDNYQLSMSAMSTVAANNGVALNDMKDGVKAVTDATSIGGGQAREYFNTMVNMGVTNTRALSDSMIGLQGSTVITGGSFDAMKGKMVMLMNSTSLQARAITSLGLSMEKLAEANGMTVDELKSKWASFTPDEKLQALNNGLAQNKKLTEDLAQTSGDKLKEIENSWGALQIAIGQSTSGTANAIYDLTNNGIQGLTWAVQNVPGVGAFAGLAMSATSVLMSISPLITTVNQLSTAYGNAVKFIEAARGALDRDTISKKANAIQTKLSAVWERVGAKAKMEKVKATLASVGATAKESLSTAANAVKTKLSAMWDNLSTAAKNNKVRAALASAAASTREGIATALSTLKTKLSVVWQNIATTAKQMYAIVTGEATLMEYGFLAPLLLIIGAIAVLTAGIYLLGQHMGWWKDWGGFVDAFKARLMGLWNSFMGFVRWCQQGFAQIGNAWNNLRARIISIGQTIYSGLTSIWSNIVSRITSFTSNLVSRVVNLFRSIPGHVSSALGGLYNALVRPFTSAYNSICGIVNNIKSQISSIPQNVGSFLGFGFNTSETDFTTGENFTELLNNASAGNNNSVAININGIIENDAKEYICNTISEKLKKENLINGVIS